jgi:hypothetical protein
MSASLAIDFDNDSLGNAATATFEPVGPRARGFVNDRKFISSIMGPYGSAKTTSCFQKILNVVAWQVPNPRDGIRRIRVCCIRQTYGQLEDNAMKDWFAWFPKTKENWNGERYTHTLTLDIPGLSTAAQIAAAKTDAAHQNMMNGRCIIEMVFRGLGELKAEAVFKGMQLTLLWLNEADTLSRDVLNYGLPRVGRFPAAKDGGCAWSGIITDFNAPEIDNWTYDLLVNKDLGIPDDELARLQEQYGPDFGINFWRQPGGLDPEAENLGNLPPGYYERLIIGFAGNDNKVRRFVHNEFGAINNGQPVYPEFNDALHVAKEFVRPIPGRPIHIAIDGGSTPAAVFGQEDEDGQIRILGECVVFNPDQEQSLAKMGPRQFGRECREYFDRMWPHGKVGEIWGDPAGFFGGGYGGEADEDLAWMQEFGRGFGKSVRSAPGTRGNRVTIRIEAVRGCLTTNVGAKPGILVSPIAKHLRRGFNNGYVIQRIKFSDGTGRWKDQPNKNDFSHVHDALQYLVLGLKKRGNATDDMDAEQRHRRKARGNVDFGGGYFSGGNRIGTARPKRRAGNGRR